MDYLSHLEVNLKNINPIFGKGNANDRIYEILKEVVLNDRFFHKKVMIMKNNFKIGNRIVGYKKPCFFIAEDRTESQRLSENAKKLIYEAKQSGCDAVKFQYHIADEEIADKSTKIPCK